MRFKRVPKNLGKTFKKVSTYFDNEEAGWEVVVINVFDGDTLIVSRDGYTEIIRLYGIDCLEKKQPFGLKAKDFTMGLVSRE